MKLILKEFPFLKDTRVINLFSIYKSCNYFIVAFYLYQSLLTSSYLSLMNASPEDTMGKNWEEKRGKILELAKMENKPSITILLQLANTENIPEGKIVHFD